MPRRMDRGLRQTLPCGSRTAIVLVAMSGVALSEWNRNRTALLRIMGWELSLSDSCSSAGAVTHYEDFSKPHLNTNFSATVTDAEGRAW